MADKIGGRSAVAAKQIDIGGGYIAHYLSMFNFGHPVRSDEAKVNAGLSCPQIKRSEPLKKACEVHEKKREVKEANFLN